MSYEPDTTPDEELEAQKLVFKLLAAQALADEKFYGRLKKDPNAAAEELSIHLGPKALERLASIDWDSLEEALPTIRKALSLQGVARASW